MSRYTIRGATVKDADMMSYNNMSAYWTNPNWVLSWTHLTLPYLIEQSAKRYPRNMLRDRDTLRHQVAIDPESGRVVGYARWELPHGYTTTATGEPEWPEAQVPDVSPAERDEFERLAASADWKPQGAGNLDGVLTAKIKEIKARKPYLALEYLAVHPDNKGKGIATQLVEKGIEQAERLGIDSFVMAYKAGRGVYKRLGYEVEHEIIQDDSPYGGPGEYGAYFMIYETKPQHDA